MKIDIENGITSTGLNTTSDTIFVSSGGTAINTTLSGIDSGTHGFMLVEYGGSAKKVEVGFYGQLNISSGATVTEIKENGGCVNVMPDAHVTFVSNTISGVIPYEASVHSGTTACETTISSGGQIYVFSGGLASKTVVDSSGRLTVISGGTAINTTVSSGAILTVREAGNAASITVLSSGSVSVQPGGSMQNIVVSSGGSLYVSSGATATNVTLSGGRLLVAKGGTVESFVNKNGKVYAGDGAVVISKGKTGSKTKLEISSDCDSGWNNYLYSKKKSPTLNTSVYSATAQNITSKTKGVLLDKNGEISHEGKSNYVGYGDEADFTKITLTCGARLAFNLEATGAAKFTIWSLTVTGYDKKGNPKCKMKALQTVTLKKGQSFTANTLKKAPLLVKGDYYISVQAVKPKKGGSAYYNVSLNSDDSKFYFKGDDFDNVGSAFADSGYSGKGHLGTLTAKKTNVLSDWVGFGDAVDYRKFTLASAAKMNLTITVGDAAKFSICRVNDKGKWKTVKSVKLKKNGEKDCSVLLDAGDYYFCVKSTNAKKGGDADYTVTQNNSVFFDGADPGDDWDNMKKEGDGSKGKFGKAGKITGKTNAVVQNNWVGYSDPVDFFQFTLDSNAELSFNIRVSDVAKFTVYELKEKKKTRKGVTTSTFSLKKLQTTKLVGSDSLQSTGALLLKAGKYYFSMESTNAKKGGKAAYDVFVKEFKAMPKSEKDACALSLPDDCNEWDPDAGPDGSGIATPETSADAAAGLVWLSDSVLAGMEMSGLDGDSICVSPIPVPVADDLFNGLATASETIAAPAGGADASSQNDDPLAKTKNLLA